LVFGLSGVINRALGFLLIPFYTRNIGPREYGVLAILMIIYSAIPVVLRMGLGNALLRSWYDYEEADRPVLATTVFVFLMVVTIPILAGLLNLASPTSYWLFETTGYTRHLQIICALSLLEIINVVPDTLLRVRNASLPYSLCQTVGFITQLSTIIYLVVYRQRGIEGILLGNLVGSALENSLLLWLVRRDFGRGFNYPELRKMLAFGTPLIFGRLAAVCFQSIDRFFLKHYANERAVGLYALANQLVSPINVLVSTPFGTIWPNMQFAVMKDPDAKEYYARMLTYIVFLGMFFALPLAILVTDILHLFASPKYWEAANAVPWLAFAAVLDTLNPALSVGVSLKRKSYLSPFIVIASALINIALNFWLIPRYGMQGAAIATVLSFLAMCAIRYQISNWLLPINYEWWRLIKIFSGSLLLFLLGKLITHPQPWIAILLKLPCCIALPVVLGGLNFYDAAEKQKLRDFYRQWQTQGFSGLKSLLGREVARSATPTQPKSEKTRKKAAP
jgi:O-antigen/teichoic acid export membrane protein